MILVITKNKNITNLVNKYISEKEINVEEVSDSFYDYVEKDLLKRNLEKFNRIIINITEFNDEYQQIVKAVAKIKIIYNIQIIVIAIGYKVGNEVLSELFDIGIYDFITSEDSEIQREEWIKSLDGNNYIDSVKYKIKSEQKKKIKKVNKIKLKNKIKDEKQVGKFILTCFNHFKSLIKEISSVFFYILLSFLASVGATALINSNIRNIIMDIIKGGL